MRRKIRRNFLPGFTIMELMMIFVILGILATIIIVALTGAREKGKVGKAVAEYKQIEKAFYVYHAHTGVYPICASDNPSYCYGANDPFMNSLGVPGWSGPYFPVSTIKHPWGGAYSVKGGAVWGDWDNDGKIDYGIVINDDRPGMSGADNQGRVPRDVLIRIDQALDDGNLNTGRVRGDGGGWPNHPAAIGELVIKLPVQ